MKSLQLKKLAVISTLLALAGMAFVPTALASPITANLSWSPNPITSPGSSSTATFGVAIDSDCPSGQTYTGTVTVTEPDGTSVSTYSVSGQACGDTTNSASYPSDFTGTAGTTQCGVYSAEWKGSTTASVGGVHPTFDVTDNLILACQGVPQFGAAPALLVAAMGLVLVVGLRNKRILKI